MKLFIIARKEKPFRGREDQEIPYFWYTARTENGVRIQFGSKMGSHKVGETLELNVERTEKADGSQTYKEFED